MTVEVAAIKQQIVGRFRLEALPRPVNLEFLAKKWGVTSVEKQPIASDAMLLRGNNGYKIVLKEVEEPAHLTRQRFSFAHELGHLLLQLSGYQKQSNLATKHRGSYRQDDEERLCDQIAAEILMPRIAFQEDGSKAGWSLESLRALSSKYQTSMPATAIRMVDLMPETSLLAVWRPPSDVNKVPKLQWSHAKSSRYRVPSVLPRRRLWLIARAMNAHDVQSGIAPVVDKVHKAAVPPDVPAEALAWGQGEYRQVMIFYYPERQLTGDMNAIAKATWRTD
jgi:hypothetical protein